ncbi:hypothetical protein FB451DRAFT_968629, partial [Mycena latifolia]
LRSTKAPSLVDVEHMAHHGCVATNVEINPKWTHEDCTENLTKLFPTPIEYAKRNAKSSDKALWVIATKEHQHLRIVPRFAATGADLVQFKVDKKS